MPTETPCVKICVLDPVRKLCTGCGRTLDEIARWAAMSAEERRHIMDDLPRRRERREPAEASSAGSA